MRFRSVAVVCLSSAAFAGASAQAGAHPTCAATTTPVQVRDACQQAVDIYQLMMPQLGFSIAGGNATLGQGGTLGGLPHWAISLRGNVLLPGSLPVPQEPDTTGIQSRDPYETEDIPFGLPSVDAAIGVFKGFPLALTNVGGVDLLLSAAYIPNFNSEDESSSINVEVDSPLKIGYGVRIGLLQESLVIPGLSFTYFKRDLPVTSILASSSTSDALVTVSDTLGINDFTVKTTAWRIVASKSFLLFGVAAGYGKDKYDASTSIRATVVTDDVLGTQSYSTGNVAIGQALSRTNMFVDLSMNLFLFKLVGEVGRVSGGTVTTLNTFDPTADAARNYFAGGIRIGF
jgi:hypothetical protein